MAAKKKPAKKTYPAKRAGKGALPKVLDVEVTLDRGGEYHARARNKSAVGITSPSFAVRRLAQLLGYRPSVDVRYVRNDAGTLHFQIVEVGQ